LCFKCDEPFTFGHKCKNKSIMLIESEESEANILEEGEEGEEENLVEPPRAEARQNPRDIFACHGWKLNTHDHQVTRSS